MTPSRAPGWLGSVVEAEDVVQETFARYAREDRGDVETPQAFLTTTATRLAIDRLRGASKSRETYIGPWLPEPLKGADRVAPTLLAFARLANQLGAKEQPALVNGQPGARFLAPDGRLVNVVALDIDSEGIRAIRSVVNPDKLGHLGDVADAAALLREAQRRRA